MQQPSLFDRLVEGPADSILETLVLYNADSNCRKTNLGMLADVFMFSVVVGLVAVFTKIVLARYWSLPHRGREAVRISVCRTVGSFSL